MNKLDKIVEDKLRADGWMKLLPTDDNPNSQPHRFRYTDGQTTSVSIVQYGALAGVYNGPYLEKKYKQVDWDTPECCCDDCLLKQGIETLEANAKAAATFVRKIEGAEPETIVDVQHLQVDQAKNGYKKVTFYYKITKD